MCSRVSSSKISVVITPETNAFCRENKCLKQKEVEDLLGEKFWIQTFPEQLTCVFVIEAKDFDLIQSHIRSIRPSLNLFYRKKECKEIEFILTEDI